MFRTPEKVQGGKDSGANPQPVDYPSAKLGAVTRLKNEITELLPESTKNCELIAEKFNDYLLRVERLYAACIDEASLTWLAGHKPSIEEFRAKVEKIIHPRVADPILDPTNCSKAGSKQSSSSSLSAARVRLAERKVQLQVSKLTLDREKALKETELKLAIEKQKLQQEQEALRINLLEEQFQNLQICSGSGGGSKATSDKCSHSVDSLNDGLNIVDAPVKSNNANFLQILRQQNDISSNLMRNQVALTLPKSDIVPFDGSDITTYKSFVKAFTNAIEVKCLTEQDKFLYLQQYTAGDARKLVDTCSHYDAAVGYLKAVVVLNKEYGNEHKVANEFISKLNKWPIIKKDDAKALSDLSLYLQYINNYIESMHYRNQLQSPKELMSVILKLPYKLRESWRRKTHEFSKRNVPVSFSDLVDFVSDEASLLKQPIFSDITDDRKPETKRNRGKVTNMSVKSGNSNEPSDSAIRVSAPCNKFCFCCKKSNHELSTCRFFRSKPRNEKVDFIKKLRLCFGCLKKNHTARNCSNKLICAVCKKSHPTVLHFDAELKSSESEKSDVLVMDNTLSATTNKTVSRQNSKVMYPVLPVKLKINNCKEEILTNVVFDSCSSDCWINESVLTSFSVNLCEKSVKLTTMADKDSDTLTKVVNNIELKSLNGNHIVSISVAYSRKGKVWPFDDSDIPTLKHVDAYPHLCNLPIEFINKPITLLIGMNVPCMLKPLQIIEGLDHEPFASLHFFGWALNGPIKGKEKKIICNKVSVSDNEEVHSYIDKIFALDFADDSDGVSLSLTDEKWLTKVKNATKLLPINHFEMALPFKENCVQLPNNRKQAYGCFVNTSKKCQKEPKYFEEYKLSMKMMIEKDYMELVPTDETTPEPGRFDT